MSEFGRMLMRWRVDLQPQGCSLFLCSSAPFLKVGVYLAVCGLFAVFKAIISRYLSDLSIVRGFIVASFVASLSLPTIWGRR